MKPRQFWMTEIEIFIPQQRFKRKTKTVGDTFLFRVNVFALSELFCFETRRTLGTR